MLLSNYSKMLKKILFNYLKIILVFALFGCEDFYNFEAKKLDKKATELIEKSKLESNTNQKIIILQDALEKFQKIQKRYPRTKIARNHRKTNKINDLNKKVGDLRILFSKEMLQEKKNENVNNINKNIDLANVEFKNDRKLESSLRLLDAAEHSISQIGDTRTKSRLSNEIGRLRVALNDKDNAFKNLLKSEKYIEEMYTDLPKKIKNLSEVYRLLHLLNKKDKKKEIEEKIYLTIKNDIKNDDNKAVAYIEIAKINLLINNIDKVTNDINKAVKLAEKSNTYLDMAKIFYKINNDKQLNFFLKKAKNAAKSKDQIFWVIRDFINISAFEYSISLNDQSYKTLLVAKEYLPSNPDERLVLELVDAFTRIERIEDAEKLISLIKPKYEKSMAYAFIGRQLGKTKEIKKMNFYLDKAIDVAPDLTVGNYEFQGLPGFSTKGRIFAEVAKTHAIVGNFETSHKLLSLIESDRFYKEGISDVIVIQSKIDKIGSRKLALNILNLGGKIVDNKLLGKIAYSQAISEDVENALITVKKMNMGFDLSQTLINIANQIILQQADPLT